MNDRFDVYEVQYSAYAKDPKTTTSWTNTKKTVKKTFAATTFEKLMKHVYSQFEVHSTGGGHYSEETELTFIEIEEVKKIVSNVELVMVL